ncbi:MAG: methyl-accepting chemotaxis protein [Bacteroidetes bacterium]|nr:methyl-accepting chemotaxis protein [Bacteroidota bacterium]
MKRDALIRRTIFLSIPLFLWGISVWFFSGSYLDQAVVHLGRISNWASFMLRNDPVYHQAKSAKELSYIPISTKKAFNSYVIKFPISFYGFYNTEKFLRVRSPLSELKSLPEMLEWEPPIYVDGDSIRWAKGVTAENTTVVYVRSDLSTAPGKQISLILSQELADYDEVFWLFFWGSAVFFLVVSIVAVSSYKYTTGTLISQISKLNRAVRPGTSGNIAIPSELLDSRFDQVKGLADALNSAFLAQAELSHKIQTTGHELIAQADYLNQFITGQQKSFNEFSLNLSEVSASANQIAKSSENITALARTINSQTQENKRKIDSASLTMTDMVTRMDKIQENTAAFLELLQKNIEEIEAITRIADVINQMNENLKLISFNAQLEAAGDRKQILRFQVVAEEVRDLAKNVEETLKKIKHQLADIIDKSRESGVIFSDVNQLVAEGTHKLHDVESVIQVLEKSHTQTLKSVKTITTSAAEQLSALSQIAQAMNQMRMDSDHLSQSITHLSGRTRELKQNGQNLADLMTEL